MANKIKNEVLIRVYVLTGFVLFFAFLVFAQTINISIYQGKKWRKQGNELVLRQVKIEADRGNILADDGSLLATSLPFYDVYFDPTVAPQSIFNRYVDSLGYLLANTIETNLTPGAYRDSLVRARANGRRYVRIKRNISYQEKDMLSKFPIFDLGRNRGGLILEPKFDRQRPFGILARRTIGYVREEDGKEVGLEGRFNKVLGGKAGSQLAFRIPVSNGQPYFIPVNDLAEVEPESGNDIQTTIDVDIQDIIEESLIRGMYRHLGDWGVVIVMDVETGGIKGIANIAQTSNKKKYEIGEIYNHAIGSAVEPGSTFKIASMMSLLEDGLIRLDDSIDLQQGSMDFYEETMKDASFHQLDSTSILHAFAISSNVGIAQLVQKYYGRTNKGKSFIQNLKNFHLNQPTGIEIDGEDLPYIKEAYSNEDDWSGITLPWMSTGYELQLTPLQLLTFYNAIANDGQMMKPYLVSEIQRYGETIERFPPTVIKRKIAKPSTIKTAKILLESTVQRKGGTAYKHQSTRYRFAGKTGTSQIDYQKLQNRTNVGGYLASFAGYFPAGNPKYSVIVMINDPKEGGIYGSQVALPIFREIADKIYQTKMHLHPSFNQNKAPQLADRQLPNKNVGARNDMKYLMASLSFPYRSTSTTNFAVLTAAENDSIYLQSRRISADRVPNVVGMGLRDALYVLENLGLKVEVNGYGKVSLQSIKPGTKVRGQQIRITLR